MNQYYPITDFIRCLKENKDLSFTEEMEQDFVREFVKNFNQQTTSDQILFNGKTVQFVPVTGATLKDWDIQRIFQGLFGYNRGYKIYEEVSGLISSQKCFTSYTPIRLLGKGAEGNVYEVCKKNPKECDLVLKIVGYDSEEKENVDRAIVFQSLASKLNISLPIIDTFECVSVSDKPLKAIVMKKMEGDLFQLGFNYNKKKGLDTYAFDEKLMRRIFPQVLHIIKTMIDYNICHQDTKMHNFVHDQMKVYIIDFGLATDCSKYESETKSSLFLKHLTIFSRTYESPDEYRGDQRPDDNNIHLFNRVMASLLNSPEYKEFCPGCAELFIQEDVPVISTEDIPVISSAEDVPVDDPTKVIMFTYKTKDNVSKVYFYPETRYVQLSSDRSGGDEAKRYNTKLSDLLSDVFPDHEGFKHLSKSKYKLLRQRVEDAYKASPEHWTKENVIYSPPPLPPD